jgi:hypothetical protein
MSITPHTAAGSCLNYEFTIETNLAAASRQMSAMTLQWHGTMTDEQTETVLFIRD